jgi:Fe2+ transport system protein FeoA
VHRFEGSHGLDVTRRLYSMGVLQGSRA